MTDRFRALVQRVRERVLDGPGVTPASLRRAAAARAASLDGTGPSDPAAEPLPPELEHYVDRVAARAWTVGDDDVDALKRTGHSEDVIYEITAGTAVGAALDRLDRGLAALRGEI